MKRKIRTPFFVVNPKSYLFGEGSLKLALEADKLADKYDVDVFFTCQATDIALIKANTKNLIITAQHMDGIKPGKGMGAVLPEAVKNAGAEASFLNHAEHPMTTAQLAAVIARADELGIITLVCADSAAEAQAIAQLKPDIMICEPTSLIGTGKTSGAEYMGTTNDAVREISPETLVLQAAGISNAKNVYDALMSGADGTGATSGIVAAADPIAAMTEMIAVVRKAADELKEK